MKRVVVVLVSLCILTLVGSQAIVAQVTGIVTPPDTEVDLGRLLFWDPILSGDKDVACATCHHPDFAWADGRALSLGPSAVGLGPDRLPDPEGLIPVVKRNSQSVLNTAFNGLSPRRRGRGQRSPTPFDAARSPMFWDSRATTLEAQALEPIKAFEEMRGSAYPEEVAVDSVVARLRVIPEYVRLFDRAFGVEGIQGESLARALASFQRSLVAVSSPVDRFREGDRSALTAQQQRGMSEFDAVGCDRCHGGPMFSDFRLHAEGVMENPLLAEPDSGGGRFRFRTPSLRNVALTAPYMHNGMLSSLEEVLLFYHNGRSENPNVASGGRRRGGGGGRDSGGPPRVDGSFRRVSDMSARQMEDIIAFMAGLTDENFERTVPERVPSGLAPGGAIGR